MTASGLGAALAILVGILATSPAVRRHAGQLLIVLALVGLEAAWIGVLACAAVKL